jgi:hypothetical protein
MEHCYMSLKVHHIIFLTLLAHRGLKLTSCRCRTCVGSGQTRKFREQRRAQTLTSYFNINRVRKHLLPVYLRGSRLPGVLDHLCMHLTRPATTPSARPIVRGFDTAGGRLVRGRQRAVPGRRASSCIARAGVRRATPDTRAQARAAARRQQRARARERTQARVRTRARAWAGRAPPHTSSMREGTGSPSRSRDWTTTTLWLTLWHRQPARRRQDLQRPCHGDDGDGGPYCAARRSA